ncbi:MAG: type IV pilus assembly protein PilM [Patescibacteria group bacterium]|nr:type IV pilus assembly protein PilM [Patescibacteria group bacterium]
MKTLPFGLDIGATTIKTVWLSGDGNGFILNSASILPTPPKGMFSESPLDQEEMARAIRKIVDDSKIATKYVNIALPESQVYTRVLEMPRLSDKELSSAIYWEAEQYIPVPLNSITLDWLVLKRPQTEAEKMEVLLVGAPTALVDKYQKVLTMAGLTISCLESEILSAVRSLVVNPATDPDKAKIANEKIFPNTLIIHIGALSTSLAIINNGTIAFTYLIPTGGAAINRAIATDFGFSESQAEEYKKVYGVSTESLGGKIGKATMPILMTIVTEVKKAVAFYNEKYKSNSPIQQILLSGGTAKLPGVTTFFTQNCGIETAIANPWNILSSQQVPKEIIDNASDYTIAVGLAIRGYE